MKRSLPLSAAFAVVLSLGLPAAPSSAASTWCADTGGVGPCILSATLNGATVLSSDATWEISATADGPGGFRWDVQKKTNPDPYELDNTTDDWVITFRSNGAPRVAHLYGHTVTITRSGFDITIAASPTRMNENNSCDPSTWPWSCASSPTKTYTGTLQGSVTDYREWTNVAQRIAMNGLNYATNVAVTSIPPEIVEDPDSDAKMLLIRMANHHFEAGGVTVFQGFANIRIPAAFLSSLYGIDDLASFSSSTGVVTTGAGSGATVSVSVESGNGAILVDMTNLTFSRKSVRIKRGVVTPTRPTRVRAGRVSATKAKVRFLPSTPRGSRIRGYTARCVSGSSILRGRGSESPVFVKGLTPGMTYTCKVRARSRAGPSRWSRGNTA